VAVLTALRHYGRYFSLHQYNVAVKDFRYCNTFETAILLFCLTNDVVLSGQGFAPCMTAFLATGGPDNWPLPAPMQFPL